MGLRLFVEGPLLRFVFCLLIVGILIRMVLFLMATKKKQQQALLISSQSSSRSTVLKAAVHLLVPLHEALRKRPFYTVLRYIFHACLFIVPIWLAGHVSVWEMSSLGWTWSALPDGVADMMTLTVIALCIGFGVRRITVGDIRKQSTLFDLLFIIGCVLPFLSGYLLAHGTLEDIQFFKANLFIIHVLVSCLMMGGMIFLFIRTRISADACVGCGACEASCPTGSIVSVIDGINRVFNYSQFTCIACGSCVAACPEMAAELRHELGFSRFFQALKTMPIRSVKLTKCQTCGVRFAPEFQVMKLSKTIPKEFMNLCPDCRMSYIMTSQPDVKSLPHAIAAAVK